LGLFNYEDRVRNLPIGVNRRRGNPGKTKSALTFQPNEIAETILSGSESEHNATTSKSKKKGAKSKKDTKDSSSDSDESDFDIFATATTATTSKKKAPKKVSASKETSTPVANKKNKSKKCK
jgi:hypothetical protein